ncbi:MAG: dihydropteroate synthase [Actinomycetia bacterium]|nr:dihydropteroate synthase [Actinomycetes bacterium]
MGLSLRELLPRPSVMGVLNVTPDSFSDGGLFIDPRRAASHAERLVREGAAIIDLGGESTRPGASPISCEEELARVEPVLEHVVALGVPVSVDTSKAEVARRALSLGACMVNDITGLRGDAEMADAAARSGAYVCLMHMQGDPRTMQEAPSYHDIVTDVRTFLEERVEFAISRGIAEDRICVDPGIGFGKTAHHNLELISRLEELADLGVPVLVGTSRKSFLGRVLGDASATSGPLAAGLAAAVSAYQAGASIVRSHDVREHVEALRMAAAIECVAHPLQAGQEEPRRSQ